MIVEKEIVPMGNYYKLTTGHNNWGNDSIDSIENKDICSDECLKQEFDNYINISTHKYGTAYFEVEMRKWFPKIR